MKSTPFRFFVGILAAVSLVFPAVSSAYEVPAQDSRVRYFYVFGPDADRLVGKEDSEQSLFEIKVKVLDNTTLASALKLNFDNLFAEAYFGNDLEIGKVELSSGEVEEIAFAVAQNKPNPWNNQTSISITVPQKSLGKLIVQDVLGATVFARDLDLVIGKNEVHIDNKSLSGSGLYFYTIINGDQMITKQMIKL